MSCKEILGNIFYVFVVMAFCDRLCLGNNCDNINH